LTKTVCDWCGDDIDEATGKYSASLIKLMIGGTSADFNCEDLCGYCANQVRVLRDKAKRGMLKLPVERPA
jgi:hypothetical protein